MLRMVNSNHSSPLILAGASVRSLAESAVISGIRPMCFDMFADADLSLLLRENGLPDLIQISKFTDLVAATSCIPAHIPLVWMGGLENHPEQLRTLSQLRPVCGVHADDLGGVRNPTGLQSIVTGTGCRVPAVISGVWHKRDLSTDLLWLAKPIGGAGGNGIRDHNQGTPLKSDEFLQQKVFGNPVSAVYYHDGQATEMLGASAQVIGEETLGGSDFAFCGNVGPIKMRVRVRTILRKIGERLGDTGLRGVFGADFIVDGDDVWLIEVNPRITASHEIYDFFNPKMTVLQRQLYSPTKRNNQECQSDTRAEQTGSVPPIAVPPCQQEVCRAGNAAQFTLDDCPQMLARLVIYLKRDTNLTASNVASLLELRRTANRLSGQSCWLADIPHPGDLPSGQPFCSVYHILEHTSSGWIVTADHSQTVQIDAIVSQLSRLSELDSAATAIRYASLGE